MEEQQGNEEGVLTADQVIAMGRETLVIPSGGRVVFGRLDLAEIMELVGEMPDVSALAVESGDDQVKAARAAKAARKPATRAMIASMSRIIVKGVLKPQLFEKPEDGPTPLNFSMEDRAFMYVTILRRSGYSKEVGAEVLPLSKTGA
jgi:hypothetical protein